MSKGKQQGTGVTHVQAVAHLKIELGHEGRVVEALVVSWIPSFCVRLTPCVQVPNIAWCPNVRSGNRCASPTLSMDIMMASCPACALRTRFFRALNHCAEQSSGAW